MVKEAVNSFVDNIKERTTNPFLGTFAIVWIIRNWRLVYSLFYFDSDYKLKDRLDFISKYFVEVSFIANLGGVIFLTVIILVFTYLMLSLSRLITEFYDKVMVPDISRKVDKSSVVLKSDYIKLQDLIKQLETRLEEERVAKVNAQKERDDAYARFISIERDSAVQNEAKKEISTPTESIQDLSSLNANSSVIKALLKYDINEVQDLISDILDYGWVERKNPIVRFLLRENVIKMQEEANSDMAKYTITPDGRIFLNQWNRHEQVVGNEIITKESDNS